jgi:hypothetical protein
MNTTPLEWIIVAGAKPAPVHDTALTLRRQ